MMFPLRRALIDRRPVNALLCRLPCETVVDMAGSAGFNVVVFDAEHGPADEVALESHISRAARHGMASLVRMHRAQLPVASRLLDLGATGIVLAHVSHGAGAAEAVRLTHFPPTGDRGFAGSTLAGGFGAVPAAEMLERARHDTVVIAMVEDKQGFEEAESIIATPGIDAVLVGVSDLAVALGCQGDTQSPVVQQAVAEVRRIAFNCGVPVVELGRRAIPDGAADPGSMVIHNASTIVAGALRSAIAQ